MLEQLHVVLVVFAIKSLDGNPSSPPEECSPVVADSRQSPSNLKTRAFIPSPFAASCDPWQIISLSLLQTLTFPRLYKPAPKTSISQPSPQVKSKRQHAFPCPAAVSSVYSLLFSTPQASPASSPSSPLAFFKASNRLLFLFPIILSVFFFSISAILSQFEIRLIDPSTLTTMGPR